MKKIQISPSKLFIGGCPRALQKYMNEEEPNSAFPENTEFGSAFHNIMDYIIQNYDEENINSLVDKAISLYGKEQELDLRRYVDTTLQKLPIEKAIATELELGLDENFNPTSFEKGLFHGRLDLVIQEEDEVWIIDYKTSFKIYNPESLQIKYYAWLITKTYPDIHAVRVGLYFPRYGALRMSDVISDKEMAEIERTILAKAQQVWENADKDEPIPGGYCTYCNWIADCPVSTPRFITTEEEAKRAAGELMKLEAQVKDLKQKLQRWVEYHGPIEISDEQELTFAPSTSEIVKIPPKDIPKAIEKYPDLEKYISISAYYLKRKNHPILEEYPIVEKSTYTKFGFKKKKVGVIN